MSAAEKALAACIAHAKAKDEIARLSTEIGEHLCRCPGVNGETDADAPSIPFKDHQTHLARSYEPRLDDGYFEPVRSFLSNKEIVALLTEECSHCLAAHNAIQTRKQARQKLGAARRWITRIGREAA